MPRSTADVNTEPCQFCGKVIRYKADIPRHNRLHTTNKEELMHKCPFPGCEYKNLQKSNVSTHFRTHTGEKPKSCPDCEYTTSDPGSLTRHRKRIHGYEPKKKGIVEKGLNHSPPRHSPYAHEFSLSLEPSSSTSQGPLKNDDQPLDLTALYQHCFPIPLPTSETEGSLSFPWEKNYATPSSTGLFEPSVVALPTQNSPRHLLPAADAGHFLEHEGGSNASPVESQSSLSYEDFLMQFDLLTESLMNPVKSQADELPWTFNLDHEASQLYSQRTTPTDFQDWNDIISSFASSDDILSYTSSPASSYSSFSPVPDEFSLCDIPGSGSFSLEGVPDFLFTNL